MVNRKRSPRQRALQLNFLIHEEVITLFFISIFKMFRVHDRREGPRVRHFLVGNSRLT